MMSKEEATAWIRNFYNALIKADRGQLDYPKTETTEEMEDIIQNL